MARRRKDETCGTDVMFEIDATVDAKGENARAKAPGSAAFAYCPSCHPTDKNGDKKTGLVKQGRHLVWRPHNLVTWAEHRRPCISSGVAVCQHPPTRAPSLACPCGAVPTSATPTKEATK